jgi:hypothetical protein
MISECGILSDSLFLVMLERRDVEWFIFMNTQAVKSKAK